MGRGEKVFFFLLFLPLATKQWNLPRATKQWNLPKATKQWNFPKATKQWNFPRATKHENLPLATEFRFTFTSFLFFFFKGANSDH